MKKIICLILSGCMTLALASCKNEDPVQETAGQIELTETTGSDATEPFVSETQKESIDYLILVNNLNKLPEGWEDSLETVSVTNSVDDTAVVEKKTYNAFLHLKDDLENNEGVCIELDSGYRSVAEQQDIMNSFTEKYGADYAAKTVAKPGYSEHHTGLAVDLYLRFKNGDGTFSDVYYNEDMVLYPEVWEKVHAKLAEYGFILRYPEGSEHITGYGYEPWHIRYVDSAVIAKDIMTKGITLEEYLGAVRSAPVTVDLGSSDIYSDEELNEAVIQIKCRFASWGGCELHAVRYDGDDANTEENLEWLNTLGEVHEYSQIAKFAVDFHTPGVGSIAWNPDEEYIGYEFWLARTDEGGWDIVSMGEA